MGKIADAAKSVAWLGAVACVPSAVGGTARQAIKDAAYMEKVYYTFNALGIPGEDVQRHTEIVRRLSRSSPVFSNRMVEIAGMELAKHNVMKGEPVIPENPRQWACELWDEIITRNYPEIAASVRRQFGYDMLGNPVVFDGAFAAMHKSLWLIEAEKLWNES